MLQFNDHKNSWLYKKNILKGQQRFKSKAHDIYTEEINKIALSNYDGKRLQILDRLTYPFGTNAGKFMKKRITKKIYMKKNPNNAW